MRFNVRSALAAVGGLAEGRLTGEIEARAEQQRRAAGEFQRSLALTQLDQGAQGDQDTSFWRGIGFADPTQVGVPISAHLKAQAGRPLPSDTVAGNLSPMAQNTLSLHPNPSPNGQPMPVGGSNVTGLPASGGNPVQGTTSPSSPGPSPSPAPAPPPPAGPMQMGSNPFMMGVNPFSGAAEQAMRTMAPMIPFGLGNMMLQSMSAPPPIQAQPPTQAPLAMTGPSGTTTGAAPAPQPGLALGQDLPPPPPPPAPAPAPHGIIFPEDPTHEVPVAGTRDQQLRVVFNEMNRVAGELAKVDLKDNPHALEIVRALQSLPGYDSGRTPEGLAQMGEATNRMRGWLAGAQKVGTPAQAAAADRARTQEKHRQNTDLQTALKDVAPNAPIKVLRHIIHRQGLDDDFADVGDTELRQELMGGKISESTTKIRQLLLNASHASPGEMADLVSQLNGLKGLLQPGSFKVPMSEYLKLSKPDRERLLAQETVRVDRHQAATDKHNAIPKEEERRQVAIDEARARIRHLDQVGGGGKKGGLSAVARLRSAAKKVDDAAIDLRTTLSRPEFAGIEARVRPFVEAHFGDWLDHNDSTLPPKEWEKIADPTTNLQLGAPGTSTRNLAIIAINKMLRKHQATVQLDEKQMELEKENQQSSGASQGSANHWPDGFDQGKANQMYDALLGFKWTAERARNEILTHPERFKRR